MLNGCFDNCFLVMFGIVTWTTRDCDAPAECVFEIAMTTFSTTVDKTGEF